MPTFASFPSCRKHMSRKMAAEKDISDSAYAEEKHREASPPVEYEATQMSQPLFAQTQQTQGSTYPSSQVEPRRKYC